MPEAQATPHAVVVKTSPKFESLFSIEIVGIPKYDDCSIEVHPCRGTSGYTDRGHRKDA
jgi:hypothetical protein